MEKLGTEPAFPCDEYGFVNSDMPFNQVSQNFGMTKRFYAACAAMQGLLANPDWAKTAKISDDFDEYKTRVVNAAFEISEELLKQE